MEIFTVFRESFLLLLKQPKLFLPKLVVAFLYGIAMLVVAALSLETFSMVLLGEASVERAWSLLAVTLLVFVYSVAVLAIDVLVNAMYPVMVSDFRQSKAVSFGRAFRISLGKFSTVFPAVIIVELASAVPFALLLALLIPSGNFIAFVFSAFLFLCVSFFLIVLFYVVYPVAVLKQVSFLAALANSVEIGKSNIKQLSLPSVIPFFLSLANFALAFFASNPALLLAFIVSRFFLALVYTYHMVINPNVYFALVGMEESS